MARPRVICAHFPIRLPKFQRFRAALRRQLLIMKQARKSVTSSFCSCPMRGRKGRWRGLEGLSLPLNPSNVRLKGERMIEFDEHPCPKYFQTRSRSCGDLRCTRQLRWTKCRWRRFAPASFVNMSRSAFVPPHQLMPSRSCAKNSGEGHDSCTATALQCTL